MTLYTHLAIDAGARIVGGCCGTSPDHLAAMRRAVDQHRAGTRPDLAAVVAQLGALVSPPARSSDGAARRTSRRRG
jgi:5-methyltetrahydrofolate--homocysteine methyltransferase